MKDWNKWRILRVLSVLVTIVWAIPAHAQFVNGDFSLGNPPPSCDAGTGWTTGPAGKGAQRTQTYQPGNTWLDLTPCNTSGNDTWIEQAVPVTIGACYRIDFDLASHCGWDGSRSGVYISIDGQQLGGWIANDSIWCPAPFYWERKSSLTFVAVNNPTVVRFTGEARCRDYRTGARPCAGEGQRSNPEVIALDNIELVQVSGQALNLDLGNDTVYCDAFTRVLDAGNAGSGTTYMWSTGEQTQTINVNTPGDYWVTVTTMCGTASDTIRIRQSVMPDANLGADVLGCLGNSNTLAPVTAAPSGTVYRWSNGASSPTIQATQAGDYWLELDANGCVNRDTITVTMIDIDVDLGADISVCETEAPIQLSSSYNSSYQHLWSNGRSDVQMEVTRSGNYWLEVSLNGCKDSDTIYVDLVPTPHVFIGYDSTICAQFPHKIGTEIEGASYKWSTGATTPYITVNSSDAYVLEVSLRGCKVYDTVNITAAPAPIIDLGGDRDICPDQTIVLDATTGSNSIYSWNTGASTGAISVTDPGTYGVRVVTEHKCIGGDTVVLSYYPIPTISLGPDTNVCEETPLVLRAWTINTDSVYWSDGSTGNTIVIRNGGNYIATAFNKCGSAEDTIDVAQIFCNIWAPNVFSPNKDGKNDVYRVLGNLHRVQDFGLSIYNRWGERIFHTRDKRKGWDGYLNGAEAEVGTYLYLIEYSFDGQPHQLKGSFHLLR